MNAMKMGQFAVVISAVFLTACQATMEPRKGPVTQRLSYHELNEYKVTCEHAHWQHEFLQAQLLPTRLSAMTSHAADETTRNAMRSGLYNYVVKEKIRRAEQKLDVIASSGMKACLVSERNEYGPQRR